MPTLDGEAVYEIPRGVSRRGVADDEDVDGCETYFC